MLAREIRRKRIKSIALSAFVLMGCAMVVGFCVAKMINNLPTGTETRQIAKWNVVIEGSNKKFVLVAGGSEQVYELTVTNNSEVSSEYNIVLTGVPDNVMVGIDGGEPRASDNGSVTLRTTGDALGIGASRPHTLEFVAPIDTEAVDEQNIAVSVQFKQEMPR